MRDAEMLLLVDDDQPQILELDGLAEERVSADNDVDLALGETILDESKFLWRDQS